MKKKSWKTGGKLRSKNFGKLQAFEQAWFIDDGNVYRRES